jgi:hypothetical protein
MGVKTSPLLKDISSNKSFFIGKHFINFFYFLINIIEKFKTHKDSCIIIGLNFDSILIQKQEENNKILIIDNLYKLVNDNKIEFKFFDKYFRNLPCYDVNEKYEFKKDEIIDLAKNKVEDILQKWDCISIEYLEREISRLLHYCLIQDEQDFIKLFIKNSKFL